MRNRTPYPKIEQMIDEEGTDASVDEANDPEFEEMPHLAEGDIIGGLDDPFSVDSGASSTVKTKPMAPPPQMAAAPTMPQPMAPKPAPVAAPAAIAAKATNPRPLPGMPADVTPDMIKGYLDQQRAKIDKYSPDKQFEVEKEARARRNGLGANVSQGLSNFADAVMQGVAGEGSLGAGQRNKERLDDEFQNEVGAFERARKGTAEQAEAEQKIDLQDPKSTMSMMYQKAFGPIFQKMGYSPAAVAKMPASQIQTLASLGIQYEDAATQNAIKRIMLGIQGDTAKANMVNQQAERAQAATNARREAAEATLRNPDNATFMGVPVPFTKGRGPEAEKAREVLSDMMTAKPQAFKTEEEAAAAGLPDGARVTIGGVTGTWRHK